MKHRFGMVITTATVLTILIVPVHAAQPQVHQRGAYAGLGVVGGLEHFSRQLRGFGDSAGFNARLGYRFTDYFAAEGFYEYMDKFGLSQTFADGARAHASLTTHSFSLMGKINLPNVGNIQPFVSPGIGFLAADSAVRVDRGQRGFKVGDDSIAFAGRVNGGLDFLLTERLGLTLEAGYVMPTGNLSDLNYISFGLGARYHFQ